MDQDIKKKYDSLPKDVKAAIDSSDVYAKVEKIGKKHMLHIDRIGDLATIVANVMLGYLPPEDFVTEIEEVLELSVNDTIQIAAEINIDVFIPIRESLIKMNSQKMEIPAQKQTPQVNFGAKFTPQTSAYPPSKQSPAPAMPKFSIPSVPKGVIPPTVSPKPTAQIQTQPKPLMQQPPKPAFQPPAKPAASMEQPKPSYQAPFPPKQVTIQPQVPSTQLPASPKIMELMKKSTVLEEIENPAPTKPVISSETGKGMIDEKMADRFIAGKLKKISDSQIQKTTPEQRPPQSSSDPYRENLK